MTLRRRLVLGLLLLLAVFVAGAAVTVLTQREHLRQQIDDQLQSTPLPGPNPPPRSPADESALEREEPFSGLYIAQLEPDGSFVERTSGQRLTDTPDLSALEFTGPDEQLVTVDGVAGTSSFRVRYAPPGGDRPAVVVALPLDDVEASVRNLIYTSAIVAALLAAVSAFLASWVNRYGLKPISEMTDAADAIAAGDTTTRADSYGDTTEAGRLALALNLMLDERDEAESTLRSFVSNASHELRTPLTSIRGYLDLYDQGAFREAGQLDDVVRRMRIESARMNLLVEDLLMLAKLDEGYRLQTSAIDIALLLNDVAASARAANPQRQIDVRTVDAADIVLNADPLRVHQAVANLVDNAMTHTDATVVLEARRQDNTVQVTVADDGPGLSPEVAAHVFDRFYRGDQSRSRLSGGSGLGLSIVKSISEAHGGTVAVETSIGHGARFTITLPV